MVHVNVLSPPTIGVQATVPNANVSIGGQIIYIPIGDIYDGEYEVTPDFNTQTLETENKSMHDDVTVHPIPVHRTSNPYGTTVFIGGILNG